MSLTAVTHDVLEEYTRAIKGRGPFNSAHEAYAVLLEKVDELWDIVKQKKERRSRDAMRKEAIQVAAMAFRFVVDIADSGH